MPPEFLSPPESTAPASSQSLPPPLPPPREDIPPPHASSHSFANNDKILSILCHLSGLLGVGLVLPLIVYLVKKNDDSPVAAQAKEALNFHISLIIYALLLLPAAILSFFLSFILFFPVISLHGVLMIGSLVCAILAAIKAGEGHLFRYPLILRLVS